MHSEVETLIALAMKDGVINEAERGIILRKADALGLDRDHVEMLIEGASSNQKGNEGAPITVGVLRVCPSCNAPVEPFQQKCICNHVFQYDTLSSLVGEIQSNPSRERQIVTNYQLPFSAAAIIELFTFGYGKIQDEGLANDVRQAWFGKLNELLAMVETAQKVEIEEQTVNSMRRAVSSFRWITSVETQTVGNESSATGLLDKISEIKSRRRGQDEDDSSDDEALEREVILAIDSYPIPSKKGELLNLIALCVSNGTSSQGFGTLGDESMAWNRKGAALIEKARLMYSDDSAFVQQLGELSVKLKQVERKSNIVSMITGIVFIVAIVIWIRSC